MPVATGDISTAVNEFSDIRNQILAVLSAGKHAAMLTPFQISPAQMGLALMVYADQKAAGGGVSDPLVLGTIEATTVLKAPPGTGPTAPGLAFTRFPNTGFWTSSATELDLMVNGVARLMWFANGNMSFGGSGYFSMGGQPITLLPDPVNPQDAANKRYVDSKGGVSGLTANQVLFGKSDGTIAQDTAFTYSGSKMSIPSVQTGTGPLSVQVGTGLCGFQSSGSGDLRAVVDSTAYVVISSSIQLFGGLVLVNRVNPPSPASNGMIYYDSTNNLFKGYIAGAWKTFTLS